MRKTILLCLVSIVMAALVGCGEMFTPQCEHEWSQPTCTEGATCLLCGMAHPEQGPQGHLWMSADCKSPKHCFRCSITEGEKTDHTWIDATCTKPKTCKKCNITEGDPLGHSFSEASCTEKQVCTVCKAKGGEPLGHDYVKNTCTRCQDKEIETFDELAAFLNKNYHTLVTPIGNVEEITYSFIVNDPVTFSPCDFEARIGSDLWCKSQKSSMRYMIKSNALPFADRVQAMISIINFEMEVAAKIEEVFPEKKFTISFFTDGYKYPNIQVGYVSTRYFSFYNYKKNGSGIDGYQGTDLSQWHMVESRGDSFLSTTLFDERADEIYRAVLQQTDYILEFQYFTDRYT